MKVISLGALVVLVLALPAAAQTSAAISDGERAADSWAVQNLISRHDYYHADGYNIEDVNNDWVSPNGPFGATAAFASSDWVLLGIDTINSSYGNVTHQIAAAARHQLSLIDPKVANNDSNFGAGGAWHAHFNTTPVIEIADDGKTAQGVWYSPGLSIVPEYQDGKIYLADTEEYEKYGADFVKENGVWKIWHLQFAFDLIVPMNQGAVAQLNDALGALALGHPIPSKPSAQPWMPPASVLPLHHCQRYSFDRPGEIWPPLPVPYHSYANTFNNCNCKQEIPGILR